VSTQWGFGLGGWGLNETLGDTFGGMGRLVSECGLFDIVADRHGTTGFSTYQRGTKVLDYCLMTQDLIDSVHHCGYKPFKCNILSDHRGIFVDFSTAHLFGNIIQPLQPVALRDISSNKPFQTAPYFQHKDKFLTTVGWYEDLTSIQHSIQMGIPNHMLAERLYQQLASACKEAGSMLKRYPPAPYSPEIARMRNILRLMKLTVSSYFPQYNLEDTIAETRAKLGSIGVTIPNTLEECRRALNQYKKEFQATIREETKSKQFRQDHQKKLIQEYEQKGDKKEAAILRRIQRVEQVKKVFLKCKAARNLLREGGISHLMVPTDQTQDPKVCTDWRRVDCPDKIVALLQE
jgi:Sec-independent protein translocase protein TatA